MKFKRIFFILLIFSLPLCVFSEESEIDVSSETLPEKSDVNLKGKEFTAAASFSEFIESLDFTLNLGPAVYVNTKSLKISAPSPIFYPFSIGVLWPNYTFISVQPTVGFSYIYYLWNDNMALPAEIENRTATGISIMADVPVVVQLYLPKSRFQFSVGPSILSRIGVLSNGVSSNDSGFSGSAESDVKLINEWFWDKGRFFYISTGVSWLYTAFEERNLKFGPEVKVYFPIGGLAAGEGLQGTIINLSVKISL